MRTPIGTVEAPLIGTIDLPNILIVDDNDALRVLVRMTLARGMRKVHCDEAASGFVALAKIEAHRPQLIILDMMMPGMDGIEVCKRLRAELATALIPIIMLTARDDSASKETSLLAGVDDYIAKPFDRSDLVARVQRLLERTYGWVRPTPAPVLEAAMPQ